MHPPPAEEGRSVWPGSPSQSVGRCWHPEPLGLGLCLWAHKDPKAVGGGSGA